MDGEEYRVSAKKIIQNLSFGDSQSIQKIKENLSNKLNQAENPFMVFLEIIEYKELWNNQEFKIINNQFQALFDWAIEKSLEGIEIKFHIAKIRFLINTSKFHEALIYISQILPKIEKMQDLPLIGLTYSYQILAFHRLGQFNKAIVNGSEVIDRLEKEPKKIEIDLVLIRLYNNLAISFEVIGEIINAERFYLKSHEFCRRYQFLEGVIITLSNLGDTALIQGKYLKAEICYNQAIEKCDHLQNLRLKGLLLKNFAKIWIERGKFNKAEQLLQKAIELLKSSKYYTPLIDSYLLYANLYILKGDFEQALLFLKIGYRFVLEYNIRDNEIYILLMMADVWLNLGDIDKSYNYLKDADRILLKTNNIMGEAAILLQKARINLQQNHFNETDLSLYRASVYSERASNIDLQFKIKLLQAQSYITQYRLSSNNSYLSKVKPILQNLESFTSERNLIPKNISVKIILGIYYLIVNKYKISYNLFSQAVKLAEMINNPRKIKMLQLCVNISKNAIDKFEFGKIPSLKIINTEGFFISFILDELKQITRNINHQNKQNIEKSNFPMIVYRIDEKEGIVVEKTFNLNENDPNWRTNITLCGTLYATALGQGNFYHEGLFGSLPFGNLNYRAMIYAQTNVLSDNGQINEEKHLHSKHQDYFLVTFLFPLKISNKFSDISQFEPIFQKYLKSIHHCSDFSFQWLSSLQQAILSNISND
ncbi:tetratricopeptide repeat protein [Candidatus Harpocratesius sp.]